MNHLKKEEVTFVNQKFSSEDSVVLRFGQNVQNIPYDYLQRVSIKEGVRIIDLPDTISGVRVALLDLSSLSKTGTFKDCLATITISDCLAKDIKKYVYQSSGNTGNALAAYSARHNLKSILLYPSNSRYKLGANFIDKRYTTTVECNVPEPQIKELAKNISENLNLPLMPTFEHQIQSNKLRAYFIAEYCRSTKKYFDWHVQSLSSGYGIFGFYRGLEELNNNFGFTKPPKLLGIQQESIHPFVNDYRKQINLEEIPEGKAPTIEPTLFRRNPPEEFLKLMRHIVKQHGGTIEMITNKQYRQFRDKVIDMLKQVNIEISFTNIPEKEMIEKAGLLALIGTMTAVKSKIIKSGERVLVAFTGGIRKANDITNFEPDFVISDINDTYTLHNIKEKIL